MDELNPLRVTITVNGVDFAGWIDVRISAGIERQARDFNISATWRWPGSGEFLRSIKPGDQCEVRIGGDLVLTGYVFATPIKYDSGVITASICGRSLTSDLIDCSVENHPSQWLVRSAEQIVRALAEPYNITVVNQSGDGTALADHTIEPGETVFKSIDRLLRLSRLLSTDDERGRLVIARPGSAGRAVDRIECGVNVENGQSALDFSEMFSEYACIGQRSGTDEEYGIEANEVQARVSDPRMTRRRVLVLRESGQLTPDLARARVEWERENRISRAMKSTYELRGWRQSNGDLWRHNTIVRVVDPLIGFDRDMLITEIEYSQKNSGGTTVILTVAPPDGYEAAPGARKKGGGGDQFEYLVSENWEKK